MLKYSSFFEYALFVSAFAMPRYDVIVVRSIHAK